MGGDSARACESGLSARVAGRQKPTAHSDCIHRCVQSLVFGQSISRRLGAQIGSDCGLNNKAQNKSPFVGKQQTNKQTNALTLIHLFHSHWAARFARWLGGQLVCWFLFLCAPTSRDPSLAGRQLNSMQSHWNCDSLSIFLSAFGCSLMMILASKHKALDLRF